MGDLTTVSARTPSSESRRPMLDCMLGGSRVDCDVGRFRHRSESVRFLLATRLMCTGLEEAACSDGVLLTSLFLL